MLTKKRALKVERRAYGQSVPYQNLNERHHGKRLETQRTRRREIAHLNQPSEPQPSNQTQRSQGNR